MALLRQIEKPARARLLVVLGLKPEPLELSDFPAVFISQQINDMRDAQTPKLLDIGPCGYLAETRLHDDRLAAECRSRLTQGYTRLDPALPRKKLSTAWRLWLPSARKKAAP